MLIGIVDAELPTRWRGSRRRVMIQSGVLRPISEVSLAFLNKWKASIFIRVCEETYWGEIISAIISRVHETIIQIARSAQVTKGRDDATMSNYLTLGRYSDPSTRKNEFPRNGFMPHTLRHTFESDRILVSTATQTLMSPLPMPPKRLGRLLLGMLVFFGVARIWLSCLERTKTARVTTL